MRKIYFIIGACIKHILFATLRPSGLVSQASNSSVLDMIFYRTLKLQVIMSEILRFRTLETQAVLSI
jgi:hypothetical protein